MPGYLIDMDGVIYRGNELIPGADRFIEDLRSRSIPFVFLTNNSQRTRRDVVTHTEIMKDFFADTRPSRIREAETTPATNQTKAKRKLRDITSV